MWKQLLDETLEIEIVYRLLAARLNTRHIQAILACQPPKPPKPNYFSGRLFLVLARK